MRETLTRADIEAARQQLQFRRAELVKRHAEEIARVTAEQAEVDTLDRLAEAFCRNRPVAAGEPSRPAVARLMPAMTRSRHQLDERPLPRTNFDSFSRAVKARV